MFVSIIEALAWSFSSYAGCFVFIAVLIVVCAVLCSIEVIDNED